jgi:tRNA pseudouridine55 synthase
VTGHPPAPDGLVVVDKPAGVTSHGVVARMRRIAGTRKVGHAGTLDPMATGVLLIGLGRATRLLGHLALTDKSYDASVRLGQSTSTDDAEGDVVDSAPAAALDEVTDAAIAAAVADLTGDLQQVPASVSAVKIDGRRAYARVRAGELVEIPARPVRVSRFDVVAVRRAQGMVHVDVRVECSTGTYVRALARDVGLALGVGAHLTALRRTRVGSYRVEDARTLDELAENLATVPLADAAAAAFPRRDIPAADVERVRHGGWLPALGHAPGPVAVFGPDGTFLALVEERAGQARPTAVFHAAG